MYYYELSAGGSDVSLEEVTYDEEGTSYGDDVEFTTLIWIPLFNNGKALYNDGRLLHN